VPNQNRVNPAVALLEVVQITVYCIFAGDGIVEVPLLDHHLRLNEAGLRPLQLRPPILGAVVTHANQALASPVADVVEPRLKGLSRVLDFATAVTTLARGNFGLVRAGDLLALRGELSILCKNP